MNSNDISPVIQPRYKATVRLFSQVGNLQTSHTLRGRTAADIVEQFRSIELAEKERGFNAYLDHEVFQLAALEAEAT